KSNGYNFNYIMPPITDNDLKYRYSSKELADLDKEALLRGDYRIQTTYLNEDQLFLIGSNTDTLNKLLQQKRYKQASPAYLDTLKLNNQSNPKLAIYLDPNWIINQGLLHPDTDIVDLINQYIIETEQYRSALLSLQPWKEQNGLLISTIFVKKQ
ncbi:MAG: hypothetical protein R3240_08260, partial [Gammaproteobacteria bacterium]|nr:hypothetical protein [Gammaproteobacteria bacterium]